MGIFSNRATQSELIASEIRAQTAEDNARRLKNEADAAYDSGSSLGLAGVTAAALVSKRARDLLFQMAVKDATFRVTVARMKKAFPGSESKIDEVVAGAKEACADPEWLKGKREDVDTWDLFSDPPPPPPSTP